MSLSIQSVELFDYFTHFGLSIAIFLFPIINLKPIFLCGEIRSLCSISVLSNCSSNRTISIEENEKSLTLLGYYFSTHYPLSNIDYCYSINSLESIEVFITKYYICLYMIGVIIAEHYDEKTENKKFLASITYVCIISLIVLLLYFILWNFSYDINLVLILILGGFSIRMISLLNKTLIMSLCKTLNEIKNSYYKIKHINVILSLAGLGHLSLLIMFKHFYWIVACFIIVLLISLVFYRYTYSLFPTVKKMKSTSVIFYDSFIIKHLSTNISPTASIATNPEKPHSTSQESLLSENTLLQKAKRESSWSFETSYNFFLYFIGIFSYNLYRNYFFMFFLYDNTRQNRNETVFCCVLLLLTELVFHLIGNTCLNSKPFMLLNSLIISITCSLIEYGYKTNKNQFTLAMISILLFCLLHFHSNNKRNMKDNLMTELISKEYLRLLSISSVFISAFMINSIQTTNMIMSLLYFTVFIINIKIIEKSN